MPCTITCLEPLTSGCSGILGGLFRHTDTRELEISLTVGLYHDRHLSGIPRDPFGLLLSTGARFGRSDRSWPQSCDGKHAMMAISCCAQYVVVGHVDAGPYRAPD